MDKNPLDYDVLTDFGNQYAEQLGIRYQLPDYLAELYQSFGITLPVFNDDASWTLPMPARIVVDQRGVVRFSEANADYTVRPEPEETLAELRQVLNGG